MKKLFKHKNDSYFEESSSSMEDENTKEVLFMEIEEVLKTRSQKMKRW